MLHTLLHMAVVLNLPVTERRHRPMLRQPSQGRRLHYPKQPQRYETHPSHSEGFNSLREEY